MMTKFRWNDPPKEHDPARYDQDHDPALRFLGRKDGSTITERQKILNRLIDIDDLISIYNSEVNSTASGPGFLTGDDLKEYEQLNNFDPSFNITGGEAVTIARVISSLKAERLELTERLAALPRTDRF